MTSEIQTHESDGAATFVHSALFARTFKEGMALVEETANYLDDEGRKASRALDRDAAMAYAGASMRLTTQLMQIASWLLVLRAVREKEMEIAEAAQPKYRLEPPAETFGEFDREQLPETLVTLIGATTALYNRIARLDAEIFESRAPEEGKGAMEQLRALREAFDG